MQMQSVLGSMDRVMQTILFVQPRDLTDEQTDRTAENAFGLSLMFSGVRCVLQYAVLPFILPFIGVATDATIPLLLALNVVAMISIVFSLRRFWSVGYKYRWQYLFVAMFALVLLSGFLVMDIQAL